MKTPTKQMVYLQSANKQTTFVVSNDNPSWINFVEQQEGYFFTPEELNEYTERVIKQTLDTAAEKAWANHDFDGVHGCDYEVNKQSITKTFEETFNKFKA